MAGQRDPVFLGQKLCERVVEALQHAKTVVTPADRESENADGESMRDMGVDAAPESQSEKALEEALGADKFVQKRSGQAEPLWVVVTGMIKECEWGLDTAPKVVWVVNGADVDGLRKLLPPPFVKFSSRCAAASHHPHRFGEYCNGSSGLHRSWSHLTENVHGVHGFYPHPAAWLNLFPPARPDGRSRPDWLRSSLVNGVLKVTLAVLVRFAPGE